VHCYATVKAIRAPQGICFNIIGSTCGEYGPASACQSGAPSECSWNLDMNCGSPNPVYPGHTLAFGFLTRTMGRLRYGVTSWRYAENCEYTILICTVAQHCATVLRNSTHSTVL